MLVVIANMLLIDHETIIRTGWKTAVDNPHYFFQVGILCVVALMVLWLLKYRGEFKKSLDNNGLQRIAEGSR